MTSQDIPQSGLEIPCHLLFKGTKKYVYITSKKLEKLSTAKENLKDVHKNAAQKLLLHQFPIYQGLHNSLIQQCIGFWVNNFIQIWHCRQCHWITVSSIGCKPGELKVYNLLYLDIDETTKCKLERVFGFSKITVHFPSVQQQTGVVDCGPFAVAFATSLAFGQDVFEFQQQGLL